MQDENKITVKIPLKRILLIYSGEKHRYGEKRTQRKKGLITKLKHVETRRKDNYHFIKWIIKKIIEGKWCDTRSM